MSDLASGQAAHRRWMETRWPDMSPERVARDWSLASSQAKQAWAAAAAPAELGTLREQLADVRDKLGNLAAGLEMSANASRPSKKSEIEDGCARAVREIAKGAS